MGLAAPLSIAATGLGAVGSIIGGRTQASSDRYQAAENFLGHQYKANEDVIDATYGEAKAAQTDAFMRDQLNSTLQNIAAVRASANVEGDSPTQYAIQNRVGEQSDLARTQRVTNIRAQVSKDIGDSMMERAAGYSALAIGSENADAANTNGLLGGFGKLLSGLSGAIPRT